MEQEKVYVVISLQNGYKNYEGVFKYEREAMSYAQGLAESWAHKDHDVKVIRATLL